MSVIYFDSCLVIYLVEEHPQFEPLVVKALSQVTSDSVCISPLVEMECLVLPLRSKNKALIARFSGFFRRNRHVSMPRAVFLKAAQLRARHNIKTPDALHLATALFHGCTALWTNDDRLLSVAPDLARNVLHHQP